LAIGEGPATWDAYFGQQMRWAYGLIDILLRESPKLFPKMKKVHALNYFFLQQYYFDGLAQGIGILLIVAYFVFGLQSSSMSLLPVIILFLPLIVIQQIIFLHLQKYNIDPTREKGMLWTGKLLNFAAWPVYLLAFVSVLAGKRIAYTVTPKGSAQNKEISLLLFMPHLVLGTTTLFAIMIGFATKHMAPQLLFFAGLNTVIMYFFVFQAVIYKLLVNQSSQLALNSKA
jgi:cellulose synthase/poly-beta-1,6-N-acetylglucosamine synthase-like glycosyltransferase